MGKRLKKAKKGFMKSYTYAKEKGLPAAKRGIAKTNKFLKNMNQGVDDAVGIPRSEPDYRLPRKVGRVVVRKPRKSKRRRPMYYI